MRFIATLLAGGLLLATATPALAQQPAVPGPATLQPQTEDYYQYTASVTDVTPLTQQGEGERDLAVHLYGTTGGDPAMNGVYTFIAFYQSPADGYRVFQIGDFNTFRVVTERKGHVLLEISENVMNPDGNIGHRTRRIAVSWTAPADGTSPTSISVAPAPAG